jgi:hypothetical protein
MKIVLEETRGINRTLMKLAAVLSKRSLFNRDWEFSSLQNISETIELQPQIILREHLSEGHFFVWNIYWTPGPSTGHTEKFLTGCADVMRPNFTAFWGTLPRNSRGHTRVKGRERRYENSTWILSKNEKEVHHRAKIKRGRVGGGSTKRRMR